MMRLLGVALLFGVVFGKSKRRWQEEAADEDVGDDLFDLFGGGEEDSGKRGPNGERSLNDFMDRAMKADEAGNYAGAVQAFKDAREFEPSDPTSANNHGVALMRLARDSVIKNKRGKGRAYFLEAVQCFHDALDLGIEASIAADNLRSTLQALKSNFRYQVPQSEIDLLERLGTPFDEWEPEDGSMPPEDMGGEDEFGGGGVKDVRKAAKKDLDWLGEDLLADLDLDLDLDLDGFEGSFEGGGGSKNKGGSKKNTKQEADDDDLLLAELGLDDLLLESHESEMLGDDDLDDLLADLEKEDGVLEEGDDLEGGGGGATSGWGGNVWQLKDSEWPRTVREKCDGDMVNSGDVGVLELCGAVVLKGLLSAGETLQVRAAHESFLSSNVKDALSQQRVQVSVPLTSKKSALFSLSTSKPLQSLTSSLLGPDVQLDSLHVLATAPGAKAHPANFSHLADPYLFQGKVPTPPHSVFVLLALADVDASTAPIRIVPGSHRPCADAQPRNLQGQPEKLCPPANPARTIPITLNAGDAAILDSRTFQRFDPNDSARPVPLLLLRYVAPWYKPAQNT